MTAASFPLRTARIVRILLGAVLTTAILAGLVDASAIALGGGGVQIGLARGLVLALFGLGLLTTRPIARPGLSILALIWIGAAGILLPTIAPWLSDWTAGPPRSLASVAALGFAALLLGWPIHQLGRNSIAGLQVVGSAGWNSALLGIGLGLGAIHEFGLGPEGFGLATVGLLLLQITSRPWTVGQPIAAAGQPPAAPPPAPWRVLPFVALGMSIAAGLAFLLPYLEAYDASGGREDALRVAALFGLSWFVGVTLGSGLAGKSFSALLGALCCALMAASWIQPLRILTDFQDEGEFNEFLGWNPLVSLNDGQRVMEGSWLYPFALAFFIGSIPALLFGVSGRLALGRASKSSNSITNGWGGFLLGTGLASVLFVFTHPEWATQRVWVAIGAGGAAALLMAVAADWPRALPLRALVGIAITAPLALLWPSEPSPTTSMPFFDNLKYEVVAERQGLHSVARAIHVAGGARIAGDYITDGRNFLGGDNYRRSARAMETSFAVALTDPPKRVLWVGPPDFESFLALRRIGVQELHLACDPPELVDVWQMSQTEALEQYQRAAPDVAAATVAESSGEFDLILVRQDAPWERRHCVLRPALLATCARKLSENGALVVCLDLERTIAGTAATVAGALATDFEKVELWLLPRGWQTPSLLVSASDGVRPVEWDAELLAQLERSGLPVRAPADFGILKLADAADLDDGTRIEMRAPLSRVVPLLAKAEFRREEGVAAPHRAADALAALGSTVGNRAQQSLLPFYQAHLACQELSIGDTLVTPEYEWLDVTSVALDALLGLTLGQEDAPILRTLWKQLAPLLIQKLVHGRDVELIDEYYGALDQELGWDDAEIQLALAESALAFLEFEAALKRADGVLAQRPQAMTAQWTRARALSGLERYEDAEQQYRAMLSRLPGMEPTIGRELAIVLLELEREDDAKRLAQQLHDEFGDSGLNERLRSLLGLESLVETVHALELDPSELHPERGD